MQEDVEAQVVENEDLGPVSITQKPRSFFDAVRFQRYLKQPAKMSPLVGADIRRLQRYCRNIPPHGALSNVSVKV